MEPVPSLREVFAALAGGSADPASVLADAGHSGLPDHLVAEAIVNYADAAPVEVAEHLSPFVMAHSAVPQGEETSSEVPDTGQGLDLLAAAPAPGPVEDHDSGHEHHGLEIDAGLAADGGPAPHDAADQHPADQHPATDDQGSDLSFGAGEPGTGHPAHLGDVDQPAGDVDPAGLDSATGAGTGWLDVTGNGVEPAVEAGPDWHHGSTDTTGLEIQPDHEGDEDALGGADV